MVVVGTDSHVRFLWICSFVLWGLSLILTYLSSTLPLFDSSSNVVLTSSDALWYQFAIRPFLRWDTFHFAHIARHGYVYEHEWAFFPGAPLVMRTVARFLHFVCKDEGQLLSYEDLLFGGMVAALSCGSVINLYRLTLHHMRSPNVALLASLLSLLPSSPVTLRLAPSTEPFFTYLSYKGMLYCATGQWLLASGCFAVACMFRSNGIILAGFMIWGMLVEPFLSSRKITITRLLRSVVLTSTILMPFVWHQYSAYIAFCTIVTPAPWCSHVPPLIYGYAQSKYWNVGFLQYWTPEQLPNFLIASPPLVLLLSYSGHYLQRALLPRLRASLISQHIPEKDGSKTQSASPFLAPSIAPHAIHALILTLTLLFAAHTQIVLRLAASMPFTYWAAAWLLVEHRRWGMYWVSWSLVWGAVSIILWTTFLPPA
ncbi:glycosyltransferase family 76 protein [Fomitopsis serialis]|uniref:glycosyltransferase family 76 protein n=1 Tax=Fomitopsis serialis TaxID=139415 RepID=UPI00200788C7|nr:glycosyltransferase family 76 protein [Neoantrodia serialis]KAH9924477.1 glycosyltransferase family 76 protein [Neoantrodia serialis]